MSMTPEQSRGARGMLNWSQSRLADEAGVARATVADFESGKRLPIPNNIESIRQALEKAGILFGDDGSVRADPTAVAGDKAKPRSRREPVVNLGYPESKARRRK